MPRKAVSKAQARFLGAVAGGEVKKPGLSAERAKEMLQGTHAASLPARAKRKKGSER